MRGHGENRYLQGSAPPPRSCLYDVHHPPSDPFRFFPVKDLVLKIARVGQIRLKESTVWKPCSMGLCLQALNLVVELKRSGDTAGCGCS